MTERFLQIDSVPNAAISPDKIVLLALAASRPSVSY
jgi:hypothetical protein